MQKPKFSEQLVPEIGWFGFWWRVEWMYI